MKPLPTTAADQAAHIWTEQDRLNAACSDNGQGTIDWSLLGDQEFAPRSPKETRKLRFNYWLAVHDEIAELINNFVWKHWAKEAKEGRRFTLINAGAKTGEGTAQNVAVELTDIVFFTVSLMHLETSEDLKISDAWGKIWGDDANWAEARSLVDTLIPQHKGIQGLNRLQHPKNNEFLLSTLREFETHLANRQFTEALCNLLEMFAAAGISRQQAFELYEQKLRINFERVERGRRQVGDTKAHQENAAISA